MAVSLSVGLQCINFETQDQQGLCSISADGKDYESTGHMHADRDPREAAYGTRRL